MSKPLNHWTRPVRGRQVFELKFPTRLREAEAELASGEGQSLRLNVDWTTSDTSFRRSQVLQRLMSTRNRYRSEIFRFVNQFRVLNGELAYLSSTQNRSAESGVRNFLMDVGIVRHVMGTEKYELMPEYASVFASARDNANYVSPTLLEKNTAERFWVEDRYASRRTDC